MLAALNRLAASYRTELNPETQAVYLQMLDGYNPEDWGLVFARLVTHSKFFPTIAEIKDGLSDVFAARHRAKAQEGTIKMLQRPSKPDDWDFKLEDAYDELDARAAALWEKDRLFILTEDDHKWPKLGYSGEHSIKGKSLCRCPRHQDSTKDLMWVCYDRIMEAKRGQKPRSARALSKLLEAVSK